MSNVSRPQPKNPTAAPRKRRGVFQRVHNFFTDVPEDTPLPDVLAKTVTDLDGVLTHIDALRKHLFRALIALAVTTSIAFMFTPRFIDYLAHPVGGIDSLTAIEVTEPIGVYMRVALLGGFALALPYIVFEIWLFVAPGLHPSSRLFSLFALPVIVLFFLGGVSFAYFIMLDPAIDFMINFGGMSTQLRPAPYITFVTGLLFWIGIAFEFPLVIYVLARIGLVKAQLLREQWRLAIVIIAIAAAAITPTLDPINMFLVMAPMTVLYFLSIGLAYMAERGRARQAQRINS